MTKMTQHEKADREISECRAGREKAEKVSAESGHQDGEARQEVEDLNDTVDGGAGLGGCCRDEGRVADPADR